MGARGKLTRTEIVLLVCAAAFICAVLCAGLFRPAPAGCVITPQRQASASEIAPQQKKLDLNTAAAEELAELPGIGNVLAERIVAYRTAHGAFKSIAEIQEVNGIGSGKFSDIEDLITVEEGGTHEDSGG